MAILSVVYTQLVIVYLSTVSAQVNFNFDKSCYNELDEAVLTAQYTGNGTEEFANWFYSKRNIGNNILKLVNCQEVFRDTGLPNMTYICDTGSNTYKATISEVESSAFGEEFGVSFSLADGTDTKTDKKTLLKCTGKSPFVFLVYCLYGQNNFYSFVHPKDLISCRGTVSVKEDRQ